MNFQLSLPYAADSDLHVIEGLDVTGTPIYQRPGDWRFKPVDMYTLLQGIIERCLATQQPDGSYLVSPTIFDETMFSTDSHISYAPISQWTERTYPDGVLNEVSGYAKNLMDNYPMSLLLLAIDDKIWELGQCMSGPIHNVSFYGVLSDDPSLGYFVPFDDSTSIFQAAGVGYDPATNQLQVVPSRITGGDPIYGSPEGVTRIYPEMLIDRYKIIQQMRWSKANITDTRRYTGEAVGGYGYETTDSYPSWPSWWTNSYVAGLYAQACDAARANWVETVGGVDDPSISTYWNIIRSFRNLTQTWSYVFWGIAVSGKGSASQTHAGPKLLISRGYANIQHDIKLWGYWDGAGDITLWYQFGGGPLVTGKNLILEIDEISADTIWQAGFENNGNTLHFPPFPASWPPGAVSYYVNQDSELTLAAKPPIVDWKGFQFCKASEFGGGVTWTP